jgi:hypothetical protein
MNHSADPYLFSSTLPESERFSTPSEHALQLLEALRQSVAKALETKRRLGHYSVTWQNGQPLVAGEDAPLQHVAPFNP